MNETTPSSSRVTVLFNVGLTVALGYFGFLDFLFSNADKTPTARNISRLPFLQDHIGLEFAVGCIMAIAGVLLLIFLVKDVWDSWKYLAAFGLIFGVSTFLAYWAVFIVKTCVSRYVAAILFPIAAPMIVFLSILALASYCKKSLQEEHFRESEVKCKRTIDRLCFASTAAVICGILIIAPVALYFFMILTQVWTVPAKTLNAKNYDSIIGMGNKLLNNAALDVDYASEVILRGFVTKNLQVINVVRKMLGDFQEATPPQLAYDATTKIRSLKHLQNVFLAEETIAELEGHYADAAHICLNIICLGKTIAQGGSIFDLLLGISVESIGLQRLHGLIDYLSVADRQHLYRTLVDITENQEPLGQIVKRDLAWISRPYIWRGYAIDAILEITSHEPQERKNLKDQYYLAKAKQDILIKELRNSIKEEQN